MAFCSNCGKQLPEGARFCGNCGSMQPAAPAAPSYTPPAAPVYVPPEAPAYVQPEEPVYVQPEESAVTEPLQPETPAYAQPAYGAVPPAEPAKKKNIWKILLPIIGGVVLVALIVVLILAFSKTHVESLELDQDSVFLWAEETVHVEYTAYPEEHDDEITWISSDESVATVQNGRIEGVGDGTCTVTVRAENGVEASVKVEVLTRVYVEEIGAEQTEVFLGEGESFSVAWYAYPENYNEAITWSSSDHNVAIVSQDGVITGVSEGYCTVTIMSESGVCQNIYVEVNNLGVEELAACGEWYSYGAYLNGEYAYYDGLYLWLDGDGTGFIVLDDGEELYFNWYYTDYDYECYFYEAVAEDGSECMFVVYYDGEYAGDLDFYLTDDLWIFFE